MDTQIRPHDRFLREAEIAHRSGLSRTTRWRLEKMGKFPKRRRLSLNATGLLESEYLAWEAEREEIA